MGFKARRLSSTGKKLSYMKQIVLQKKRKNKDQTPDGTEPQKFIKIEKTINQDTGIFSPTKFADLDICDQLKSALASNNFVNLTWVQDKGIPPALKGHDLLGSAKTGSGKTLAFLIPAIELLHRSSFKRNQGTGVIIISPVRELALQIYNIAKLLLANMSQSHGVIIGGTNMKTETVKLSKHVNLLVATPGRLLDHLLNTKSFVTSNLLCLIIDEADAILKQGFEDEMNQILKILNTERQTILYSATQTKKVEDLCRVSLKQPILVGIENTYATATVSGLDQAYVVIQPDKKFLLLFTFLKKNSDKKIMVFFSSCNSVKFHHDLLNYVDIKVLHIHGKQKQQTRTTTFYEFCRNEQACLLCTDVAARGLDIPAVDWIVQYDPPDEPDEYIHRVGRTARVERKGKALLFLLPQELGFLRYLKRAKVPLNEFEYAENKLANIQAQYERLIEKNYYLHTAARDGYRSYLMAYSSHHHKDIFDVSQLDLQKVSKAFGLSTPPMVNLNLKISGKSSRRPSSEKSFFKKSKNSLLNRSDDNIDNRQFAR
jgi:ATP-dependent RNA helicase DDX18/HAS1